LDLGWSATPVSWVGNSFFVSSIRNPLTFLAHRSTFLPSYLCFFCFLLSMAPSPHSNGDVVSPACSHLPRPAVHRFPKRNLLSFRGSGLEFPFENCLFPPRNRPRLNKSTFAGNVYDHYHPSCSRSYILFFFFLSGRPADFHNFPYLRCCFSGCALRRGDRTSLSNIDRLF